MVRALTKVLITKIELLKSVNILMCLRVYGHFDRFIAIYC